jgi:hypothetical protein
MKVDARALRAAYDFLRIVAFPECKRMPAGRHVEFVAKKLVNHGYHSEHEGTHTIWVDTKAAQDVSLLLKIMAHEMIHVALTAVDSAYSDASNKFAHDENFKQMARAVEHEMGWKKGSV